MPLDLPSGRNLLLLTLLALATPALAEPAPSAKDAETAQKVRCKYEQELGSRTRGRKVCRTNADWDRMADEQRRDREAGLSKSRAWTGGQSQ